MKDYGLALPLLCMRTYSIKFNVKFKSPDKLINDINNFDLSYESNIIHKINPIR